MKISELKTKDGQRVWPEEMKHKENEGIRERCFVNGFQSALSAADVEIEIDVDAVNLICGRELLEAYAEGRKDNFGKALAASPERWLRAKGKNNG